MRYGISLPNLGDARRLADLAAAAEQHGWDGVFVWDHIAGDHGGPRPVCDPWVLLGAVAARTERLTLGPLVTPLARRRPQKVAREIVTLDHLSAGRAVLGVGLGEPPEEFTAFAEDGSPRTRAQRLDEGLELLDAAMSGGTVTLHGRHVTVDGVRFEPRPLQRPRVPVWVAGIWPHRAPFERAARWDGVVPLVAPTDGFPLPTPDDIAEICRFVLPRRPHGPFEVVAGGHPGHEPSEYEQAGATWWLEGCDSDDAGLAELAARLVEGPPRAPETARA